MHENHPYIMDLSLSNTIFKMVESRLQVIVFLKLIKLIKLLYIEMGLSESSFNTITKPFSFSSHCSVSCDSPCCVKICGEGNHCILNIDTHESIISDSDEEHMEKQQHTCGSFRKYR